MMNKELEQEIKEEYVKKISRQLNYFNQIMDYTKENITPVPNLHFTEIIVCMASVLDRLEYQDTLTDEQIENIVESFKDLALEGVYDYEN